MIKQNVTQILSELPAGVQLIAAAKTRQPEEILEAIKAGGRVVGENYVQEQESLTRYCAIAGQNAIWSHSSSVSYSDLSA